MELYEVMRTAFSARDFTGDPVPDEVLVRILENARFAPSGGNRQGGHVIVVREAATKAAIGDLAVPAAKRYAAQVAAGESPWNTVAPPGVTAETIAATPAPAGLVKTYERAPVVLVVCVDLRVVASVDSELQRVGVISGASIYPLVWNIMLAARNEGYGGALTTMPIAEEPRLRSLLGIPDYVAVAAVLPIGRPVKQLTKLRRKRVSEFVVRERWGGEPLSD
ncbi:MAG: nitroreductase [Anaerolinea sp.]|nr:nitroreductase [Anaerolinea sp.]